MKTCQRKGCEGELTGRRTKYCSESCADAAHHALMRASAKARYVSQSRWTPISAAKAIRERWQTTQDTYATIAQDYQIHPTTVQKIVSGIRRTQ